MSKRLREKINKHALEWILKNIEKCMVKEERKKFRRYAIQVSSGSKITEYSQVGYGKGRLYAKGALSIQGFSVDIRNALAAGLYHDIDMVNCHPIFLQSICKRNGWQCPKLDQYIDSREQILKDIVRFVVCTRNDAKVLMLSLLYGGKANTWKRNLKKTRAKLPDFIAEYTIELNTLVKLVNELYNDFPVPNKRNPLYSKMSLLLQDMEHSVLMVMSEFFSKNEYEPGVYIFDGLMVHKKDSGPMSKELLIKCESEIKQKTGYIVKLVEKQIINTLI